jgi:hypothetical protein
VDPQFHRLALLDHAGAAPLVSKGAGFSSPVSSLLSSPLVFVGTAFRGGPFWSAAARRRFFHVPVLLCMTLHTP